jgi:hypothetical protein
MGHRLYMCLILSPFTTTQTMRFETHGDKVQPHQKLIDKAYTMPAELFNEVETIISEIPSDMNSRVFLT